VLATLVHSVALAQRPILSGTVTAMVDAGAGVDRSSCVQSANWLGFGLELAVPIVSDRAALQLAGRGYGISVGSTCATLAIPRPDGSYLDDDRVELLSR
jgi:hypothetical protein